MNTHLVGPPHAGQPLPDVPIGPQVTSLRERINLPVDAFPTLILGWLGCRDLGRLRRVSRVDRIEVDKYHKLKMDKLPLNSTLMESWLKHGVTPTRILSAYLEPGNSPSNAIEPAELNLSESHCFQICELLYSRKEMEKPELKEMEKPELMRFAISSLSSRPTFGTQSSDAPRRGFAKKTQLFLLMLDLLESVSLRKEVDDFLKQLGSAYIQSMTEPWQLMAGTDPIFRCAFAIGDVGCRTPLLKQFSDTMSWEIMKLPQKKLEFQIVQQPGALQFIPKKTSEPGEKEKELSNAFQKLVRHSPWEKVDERSIQYNRHIIALGSQFITEDIWRLPESMPLLLELIDKAADPRMGEQATCVLADLFIFCVSAVKFTRNIEASDRIVTLLPNFLMLPEFLRMTLELGSPLFTAITCLCTDALSQSKKSDVIAESAALLTLFIERRNRSIPVDAHPMILEFRKKLIPAMAPHLIDRARSSNCGKEIEEAIARWRVAFTHDLK